MRIGLDLVRAQTAAAGRLDLDLLTDGERRTLAELLEKASA
jgi:hypothetical protein